MAMLLHEYNDIILIENILQSWKEFKKGKSNKKDVQEFERNLMSNILELHNSLLNKSYAHSPYHAFKISDPKPRDIHKATVQDRIVHHLLYKSLYPYFDKKFIYDSYSCRKQKGTHKALQRFKHFCNKVSKNNTKTVWVLKCDIKKFFANIDHIILKEILFQHIKDNDILNLVVHIINSFHTEGKQSIGLPLGNLTSQLLVNIYMNEFDQYVKHVLKVTYYIRYADDFVFLSQDKLYLQNLIPIISAFLTLNLKLEIHPQKLFLKTLASGIDFLGWLHFPHHRVLRTVTKRRMFKRIIETDYKCETVQSYLGLLKHGDGWKLSQKIFKTLN